MTNTIAQRVQRYILDGSDDDLKRLLIISELLAEPARTALGRSGIRPGWSVIECGCGPVGALVVMAEMVGKAGRAVGVDLSEATVRCARSVVGTLGLGNVRLIAGDVNELGVTALGGPFDLAFTRLSLMHQADPVRTLRQICGLLHPGGWIIAQDPLRTPPPRSFPHAGILDAYWELAHKFLEGFGVPGRVFPIHAGTLAAARERAIAAGLATGEEIDALISDLSAAGADGDGWASSPFFLELTLRKTSAGDVR